MIPLVTVMKKLLLPKEAADLLSISLSQFCRDTNTGLIPFAVLLPGRSTNKTWRYDPDKLEAWIEQGGVARPSAQNVVHRRSKRLCSGNTAATLVSN
jgi:hypothetical protein